jgi:hypothetical protein
MADGKKVEHKESGSAELTDMLDILAANPEGLSPKEWLEQYQSNYNLESSRSPRARV